MNENVVSYGGSIVDELYLLGIFEFRKTSDSNVSLSVKSGKMSHINHSFENLACELSADSSCGDDCSCWDASFISLS